jgi:hypothetical protein
MSLYYFILHFEVRSVGSNRVRGFSQGQMRDSKALAIKAISLWQPWASLSVNGPKR